MSSRSLQPELSSSGFQEKKMLQIKLMVDKIKKKVIFAEADKGLVDYLFTYLTVPIGSIIHFLGGKSYVGSMDVLYQSLNNMDESFFNAEACKSKLLKPLESIGLYIEDLVTKVESGNPAVLHQCQKDLREPSGDGVFVKGNNTYIISDDLKVMPASFTAIQNVLDKLMIKNLNGIEESSINLEGNLFQDLLRRSLTSASPLSGIYFREPVASIDSHSISKLLPKIEMGLTNNDKSKNFTAKLVIREESNEVLYIESKGEDLVDLLLSFLTYPLGFVVKLLNKCSSIGCIDNLYQSIDAKFVKSELLSTLLNHKLAPIIGCSTSLPLIGEMSASCGTLTEGENTGGGYAKKGVKFIITNNLELFPSSPSNILLTIKRHKLIAAHLEEKDIQIGKYEALNLLKACLISKNPLTDVFGKK